MGINRFVFRKLVSELENRTWLCPTRYVTSEEQVAIFLRIARTGQGNAEMQERFQRSGDTISKCFHRVLNMLVSKPLGEIFALL
ncbi:hypothetical protein BDN70DRAFT_886953 [Pholiota conissans]|uniref:DUF8040 domain-containing protein n=1 Tax=Pholiota conissans TaxID=109636 RepID=A0A9P5YPQ5_9AGAR|nr:hypothetical protein BDN70DRAFT_886953 [Pholiota conissans]